MTLFPSPGFYNKYTQQINRDSKRLERAIETVNRLVLKTVPKDLNTLLDIGCGDGKRLKGILANLRPKTVVPIDSSYKMVEVARATGIRAVCADICEYRSPVKFDVILALWNVMGHLESRDRVVRALGNICGLLTNNGVYVLDLNNRHNLAQYKLRGVRNILRDLFLPSYKNGDFILTADNGGGVIETPIHIFSLKEIVALVEEAGLKVSTKYFYNYKDGGTVPSQYTGQMLLFIEKVL